MVITPLVVAPLVLLGVYMGFYAGAVWGYSKSILAIAFSTVGFVVSILLLTRVIALVVSRTEPKSGAS